MILRRQFIGLLCAPAIVRVTSLDALPRGVALDHLPILNGGTGATPYPGWDTVYIAPLFEAVHLGGNRVRFVFSGFEEHRVPPRPVPSFIPDPPA